MVALPPPPARCHTHVFTLSAVCPCVGQVRSEVPRRTLDDAYESKEAVATAVKTALQTEMRRYGYEIVNALVTDLQPAREVLIRCARPPHRAHPAAPHRPTAAPRRTRPAQRCAAAARRQRLWCCMAVDTVADVPGPAPGGGGIGQWSWVALTCGNGFGGGGAARAGGRGRCYDICHGCLSCHAHIRSCKP
jgi:hypothetical protein